MTTATLTRSATRAEPGYGFRSATRMEWLKLRSVRSTSWILLVFAAGMIGLSVLVLSHEHWATMSAADRAAFDPVNEGFTGLALGQLVLGVLGVLAITTEFSSGHDPGHASPRCRAGRWCWRPRRPWSAPSRWWRGRCWPSAPSQRASWRCGPRPRTPPSASRACCARC